jgi:hypothetical protein
VTQAAVNPQLEKASPTFHFYCLPKVETDIIMDSFPFVRATNDKPNGKHWTKCVDIEPCNETAEARQSGRSYQTWLDPPPADPHVAHPARIGEPA